MDSGSQLMSRSRRKSSGTSNTTILSLSAFQQIFDGDSQQSTQSPLYKTELHPSSELESCECESPANAYQRYEGIDICFEDEESQPIMRTLVPYFHIQKKQKEIGTQTHRAHLGCTTIQTDISLTGIENHLSNMEMREAQLADIQQQLQLQLQQLRNGRNKLQAQRTAFAREQAKFRQTEWDLKIKKCQLKRQAIQLDTIMMGTFVKKLKLIDRHHQQSTRIAWDRIAKMTAPYIASTKSNRMCLAEFRYTQPLVSPISTSKSKIADSRPLDFSFKDQRVSMPIKPLAYQNTNQSARVTRKRLEPQQIVQEQNEPTKKPSTMKGINYPLNYKR